MLIYAFVPARSGSKGLPDKNILELDGHPLLAYSVAFGRALKIDRIILSTDSERYAEIGRRYGADVPYLRGVKASGDKAMEEEIIADMTENLPRHGIPIPDIWIRLKPTNPFRRVESVHQAIELLRSSPEADSVRIVSESDARVCVINKEGWLEPLLDHWDRSRSIMRRSEFPTVYSPFNLDVFRHRGWQERGSAFMGTKIKPIREHKITGVDINDREDFELMKAMVEARPRAPIVDAYLVSPKRL
jgi:CMP-N,N'-diacetyllegionaminic acid synthase